MTTDISLRADVIKQPMAAAFDRYPLGTLSLFSVIVADLYVRLVAMAIMKRIDRRS